MGSGVRNQWTLPPFTAGSIPFSDGTTLAENNAKLFWDALNERMGIGNAAPSYPLDVTGDAAISGSLYLTLAAGAGNPLIITANAAAPPTAGGAAPAQYVGAAANYFLADAADWLPVNVAGTDRLIPLY